MGIGPTEALIVILICLGGIALPGVILVFLYLIYTRLKRIEEKLDRQQ